MTTNTDSAKWDLIVDAASAAASSTSASGFADEAENWARKTDGEAVSGEGYSSKAWAIGGTGVTDTASSGAAKEWATKAEDSTVDGSGYSALHHAAKASASATAASNSETNAQSSEDEAEAWAQKTDGEAVTGEGYSSKAWATGGTGVTDTAGSGSAKEWATDTTNTCDGTEYSAKEYAIGTQSGNTNGSAKQWAIGGGTGFDRDTAVSGGEYSAKYWANQAANSAQSQRDVYYGAFTTDAAAETYQTGTNGGTVDEGDIYFNSTSNRLRVYDGTNWNDAVVDTTGFATAGFSIAMAIAL